MFCGRVEFAGGVWAGVELPGADGKNDGSVDGISYFKCPAFRGNDWVSDSLSCEYFLCSNQIITCFNFYSLRYIHTSY